MLGELDRTAIEIGLHPSFGAESQRIHVEPCVVGFGEEPHIINHHKILVHIVDHRIGLHRIGLCYLLEQHLLIFHNLTNFTDSSAKLGINNEKKEHRSDEKEEYATNCAK